MVIAGGVGWATEGAETGSGAFLAGGTTAVEGGATVFGASGAGVADTRSVAETEATCTGAGTSAGAAGNKGVSFAFASKAPDWVEFEPRLLSVSFSAKLMVAISPGASWLRPCCSTRRQAPPAAPSRTVPTIAKWRNRFWRRGASGSGPLWRDSS
jgi:hypothetical protein